MAEVFRIRCRRRRPGGNPQRAARQHAAPTTPKAPAAEPAPTPTSVPVSPKGRPRSHARPTGTLTGENIVEAPTSRRFSNREGTPLDPAAAAREAMLRLNLTAPTPKLAKR